MSRSLGGVIDLTADESPTAHVPSRNHGSLPATTNTHIRDWVSGTSLGQSSSHGVHRSPSIAASTSSTSTRHVEPIVVDSDDDDDDDTSFTITGQSQPVRHPPNPLQRSLSSSAAGASNRFSGSSSASSLRFHDGIGRGPHGAGSRIPGSIGILHSSSPVHHPLLPQRRAAIPSTSTTTARRSGGTGSNESSSNFLSRLGGNFPFGEFAFGTTYGMELIGSLLRGLQSNSGGPRHQQNAQRKPPQEYDPKWTHPYEAQPGFTHNIIEPPVDLETYFDDSAIVTGPLPETTPICAGCRHALVMGANGDRRLWALPCGHVIDGRCVDKLSGIAPPASNDSTRNATDKGKAKAVDPPEDEPPAKRFSTRNRVSAAPPPLPSKPSTPKKTKKPKRFDCPVQGCGQKCTKEPGSRFSAWEAFV